MPERVLEVDEEEVEEVEEDMEDDAMEVVGAGLASRDLLLEPWLLVRSLGCDRRQNYAFCFGRRFDLDCYLFPDYDVRYYQGH